MRTLGAFFRALLNINTIWGLLILSAFAVCMLQHYLPTTTTFQPGVLHEGDNQLIIGIKGPNGEVQTWTYGLTIQSGAPVIAEDDRATDQDRPWLIDARRSGNGYLLTWDADTYGKYTVTANGAVVRKGSLVTLQSLTDAAFDWAKVGFDLALGLVASMVLFLGLLKVGEKAGIVQLVARLVDPLIRFLFPEIPKDHPAAGAIVMNVTSTVLGLGNAATPFGLKAMQHLQSLNPNREVATNAQVMLLAINTAGFALIPTTLLAVRKSEGCSNPFEVIGTCMVAGATATIVAIVLAKLLGRLPIFSAQAALHEDDNMAVADGPVQEEAR
ncbi:MAG TPA: nucleoside recognition domain-containing protein [Phycisphaerae bacterium]|nr:nucleoside recognition domain-containing protein [Phycisphaerae bacterium]